VARRPAGFAMPWRAFRTDVGKTSPHEPVKGTPGKGPGARAVEISVEKETRF